MYRVFRWSNLALIAAKAPLMALRYWNWILGAFGSALIAFIAFGLLSHYRSSNELAHLVELHVAMQRWQERPQERASQIPWLCALFRKYPQMLERFGGEFLQSAHVLANLAKASDRPIDGAFIDSTWIERTLSAQSAKWRNNEIGEQRDFEEATLQAIFGKWRVVADTTELWSSGLTDDPVTTSISNDFNTEGRRAYHLMRRLAAAQLTNDGALFLRNQRQLLNAAVDTTSCANAPDAQVRKVHQPYSTYFSAITAGKYSLRDWAEAHQMPVD